jgi:cytochrome c oxidase assembly factor CtaG/putative copper export protein
LEKALNVKTTLSTETHIVPRSKIIIFGSIAVALAIAATAIGLILTGSNYEIAPEGITDTGPLIGWGVAVLRILTDIAAILTVGFLISAAFLDPSGKDGVLSAAGRRDVIRASWSAAIWAMFAVIQAVFLLAYVLGVSLSEAITPSVVSTYATDVPATRALIVVFFIAVVIALGGFITATTDVSAAGVVLALIAVSLPTLAGHGSGLGDHALALTAGVAHVVAAAIWVGGLVVLLFHAIKRDIPLGRALERFSPLALISIVLLAASGLSNAYTRLNSFDELFSNGYGQVILIKVTLIVALGLFGYQLRRRLIPTMEAPGAAKRFIKVAVIEVFIMASAIGLGVALATSAYPRVEEVLPTFGESLLGYPYPAAPTTAGVALGFHFEPFFFVGSLIAAALYVAGYIRLRTRGDAWPVMRLISWMAGIAVIIWCTNSGIALYSQVSVGLHMVNHMTLTMLGPIFLVLGAPATLALRALKPSRTGERGPREWLVLLLNSKINSLATNPFFVFFIYVVGLYGLYLTPAFGWLMGSHLGHIIMQLHFIFAGYLFYWVLIGIDPRPHPLPYWGRIILLLLAMSVHAFFSVILMMGTTPMAIEWYGVVRPDWVVDPLADSVFGGQVAWGIAEFPALIVFIAIMVQWSRSDDREAKRSDRQAQRDGDAELVAYNERLANLNQGSEGRSRRE